MAGVSDVLGQAKERIKGDVKGEVNKARDAIKAIPKEAQNQVVAAARGAVSSVVRTGIDSILGAAGDLLSGNPQAALDTILQTPGQIINGIDKSVRSLPLVNALLDSVGLSRGGISLSGPSIDGGSVDSSNGGIQEGNALAGALQRADPLMNFSWYCILPQITETVYGSVGLPWYYVEEANVPMREYQTRSIYREGRTKQYVSKYSVGNLTLTLYLDGKGGTWTYLKAWNAAIIDPFARTNATLQGGRFNPAYKHKKDIKIMLMDARKQVSIQLLLSECIPINIETISLGSGSGERVVARVTFSVGDAFMDPNAAVVQSNTTGVIPDLRSVGDAGYQPEILAVPTTDSITVNPL